MVSSQLLKADERLRQKRKSNGFVHVHSFSRSSISKEQFGGTLKG